MRLLLLLLLALSTSCYAQNAASGSNTFTMSDIPGENLTVPLFYDYDIPCGQGHPLFVYIHGWDSGAGLNGLDPNALTYLKSKGFALMSIGMRGRNTGNPSDLTNYRDAGALENYDILASIRHLLASLPAGQIDKTKICFWVISGGGGAGAGCANKFPGLISTDVLWYSISKYGSYETDLLPSLTSWYTDNANYQGNIQIATGAVPKGGAGYTPGFGDEAFISRDHISGIGNSSSTKFHVYHDSMDGYVHDDLSDALTAQMLINGQNYVYHKSTNKEYDHGKADLLIGKFSECPQYALHWAEDARTINRVLIPNAGTLRVNGYLIPVDSALNPIFEYWIKTYRKNATAVPYAAAFTNQGKAGAASVTYNLTNNTFKTHLIKGNTTVGNQWFFVELKKGSNAVTAMVATTDTVTLKPTTWNQKPLSLNYDWKFYYDFSNSDNYLLDDQNKVSNAWDLTGNNNFAWEEVRATRASISGGGLDNGIIQQAGTTSPLNARVDILTLTNELTVIFSIDPDAASVGVFTDNVVGKGSGSASLIQFGTFSGKVTAVFNTESNSFVSNSTPNNTNVGKQVWCFRRDSLNAVTATCVNSSGTYNYTLGTSTGSFIPKMIGGGASAAKQFDGKIFKIAASDDKISDTDMTSILTDWYNN